MKRCSYKAPYGVFGGMSVAMADSDGSDRGEETADYPEQDFRDLLHSGEGLVALSCVVNGTKVPPVMMLAQQCGNGHSVRLWIALQDLTRMLPPRTNMRSAKFRYKRRAKSQDNRSRAFVWLDEAIHVAKKHLETLTKTRGSDLHTVTESCEWLSNIEATLLMRWSAVRVKYMASRWTGSSGSKRSADKDTDVSVHEDASDDEEAHATDAQDANPVSKRQKQTEIPDPDPVQASSDEEESSVQPEVSNIVRTPSRLMEILRGDSIA